MVLAICMRLINNQLGPYFVPCRMLLWIQKRLVRPIKLSLNGSHRAICCLLLKMRGQNAWLSGLKRVVTHTQAPSVENLEALRLDAGVDSSTETCDHSSSSGADDESTISLSDREQGEFPFAMVVWVDLALSETEAQLDSEVAFPSSSFLFESVLNRDNLLILIQFVPTEGDAKEHMGTLPMVFGEEPIELFYHASRGDRPLSLR
ncbi:hypothetical protein FCV25MIE_20040 [Fagus crenata]